jgi:choloylglycine hydrolase
MGKIRIGGVPLGDTVLGLHVAIENASGDSAIFEFIEGKLQVNRGKEYTVMTNNPVYSQQIKNLKNYKGFGGKKVLPGNTSSGDRFVRASYYLHYLPEPKDIPRKVANCVFFGEQ